VRGKFVVHHGDDALVVRGTGQLLEFVGAYPFIRSPEDGETGAELAEFTGAFFSIKKAFDGIRASGGERPDRFQPADGELSALRVLHDDRIPEQARRYKRTMPVAGPSYRPAGGFIIR
jgi:hypothetical protein